MTAQVAVIQMISTGSLDENLQQAAELLADAAAQGAELALLPENFALMSTRRLYAAGVAERTDDGPIRSFLASQSKQLGHVDCSRQRTGQRPFRW